MRVSRRGFLAGGALTLGATSPALAQERSFAEIVGEAVDLEQHSEVAYGAAAKLAPYAGTFAGHDREHAEGLLRVLRFVRGEAPPEPEGPHEVRGLEAALEDGAQAFARFALGFEERAVAFYYEAQADLIDKPMLAATASIMANRAQRLVVLREALGREPLPAAFETGSVG